MKITQEIIKDVLESRNDQRHLNFLSNEYDRFRMYHGDIKDILERAIRKEFKKPETIESFRGRLVPINLTQKVIDKLAIVYSKPPIRETHDNNEDDEELMSMYVDSMNLDCVMGVANKYFKLNKRALLEPYLSPEGRPKIRALPAHTYFLKSYNLSQPEVPDIVLKAIKENKDDSTKSVFDIWSDESFYRIDGKGNVLLSEMVRLENPEGVNPYSTLHFIYINQSSDSLYPIADDDLLQIATTIPILLSDLSIAIKYQSWGLIWTKNFDGDIPSGPMAVLNLTSDPTSGLEPDIGSINSTVQIESVLRYIEEVIAFTLTTKKLSPSSISGRLDASNPASGIAKLIDNSESIEDKKEQEKYFKNGEEGLWSKLSKSLIPFWVSSGALHKNFRRTFSDVFEPTITFVDKKAIVSETESVATIKSKVDAGFTSRRRAIKEVNPGMDDSEVDKVLREIAEERAAYSGAGNGKESKGDNQSA